MLQSNRVRMLELIRMLADTNGLNMSGWMQRHEAAKLDAEMTGEKSCVLNKKPEKGSLRTSGFL